MLVITGGWNEEYETIENVIQQGMVAFGSDQYTALKALLAG